MLTTLYYYDYYKPYIFDPDKFAKRQKLKRHVRYVGDLIPEGYGIYLNKTRNTDVAKYAKDIYMDVVGIKDLSRYIVSDINDFLYEDNLTADEFWYTFYGNVESYKEYYNHTLQFRDGKLNPIMAEFVGDVQNCALFSLEALKDFGIRIKKDGNLLIQEERKARVFGKNKEIIGDQMMGVRSYFEEVNHYARTVMTHPMKEHMNFTDLKFFYNYVYSEIQSDTFKLIESGLLVNEAS